MVRSWINILSVALIYCGTVFGAGFASGQEIIRFFSMYGIWGIVASVFVGFLFSAFGCFVCTQAKTYRFQNAAEYFDFLFSKTTSRIMRFLSSAFLAVTFCIMITGCAALAKEQFSLPPILGALFSLFLCYFIIKNRVSGMAWFHSVITPLMFFGVIFLCALCFLERPGGGQALKTGNQAKAIFSGLLYLSYNMISAVAVLIPSVSLTKTRKEAGAGGILGGMLVGVPLVLLSCVLALFPSQNENPLPFFSLICQLHQGLKPVCGLLLYAAMLTTAVSSGVAVLARVPKKYSEKSAALLCILACLVSFIPFGTLVRTMYTAFGACGMLLIFKIAKSFLSKQ